jgi:hypothetical protein
MSSLLTVDERVTRTLSGRDKLTILLTRTYGTLEAWADRHPGLIAHPVQVNHCLANRRPYPKIRKAIADDLEIPREQVDQLIEGQAAAVP